MPAEVRDDVRDQPLERRRLLVAQNEDNARKTLVARLQIPHLPFTSENVFLVFTKRKKPLMTRCTFESASRDAQTASVSPDPLFSPQSKTFMNLRISQSQKFIFQSHVFVVFVSFLN